MVVVSKNCNYSMTDKSNNIFIKSQMRKKATLPGSSDPSGTQNPDPDPVQEKKKSLVIILINYVIKIIWEVIITFINFSQKYTKLVLFLLTIIHFTILLISCFYIFNSININPRHNLNGTHQILSLNNDPCCKQVFNTTHSILLNGWIAECISSFNNINTTTRNNINTTTRNNINTTTRNNIKKINNFTISTFDDIDHNEGLEFQGDGDDYYYYSEY